MKKTLIDSSNQKISSAIFELFNYKDLFSTLAWRDFRVRYAQTNIGFLWALVQPLVTLIILSLVFGRFIGVETEVPHILFTVAGTSIWSYFSYVMTNSGSSIIGSQNMVKKIYFPRLIIPLSKAVVGFIDFGISLLIMACLMVYFRILPSANFWTAPFFILFGITAALAVGIWLSALSVRFRDFQYIVPFMVQIGVYITPIAYPAKFAVSNMPSWAAPIYFLNPMAGVVQGFRWSIFGGEPPGLLIVVSALATVLLLVTGVLYFNKIEGKIADFV